MPSVSTNGPQWTRPLVREAGQRLDGINPVRRFLASLFRPRVRKQPVAFLGRGTADPEDGAAGAGVGAPLQPVPPVLGGRAAKELP